MQVSIRALAAVALGLGLASTAAHAQLRLSGHTTGSFTDLAEANTTVNNSADGSTATYQTGIPYQGSTQSKIVFQNATFTNVSSGEPIQTGLFSITNGMTRLGSGAPSAQFNLGLALTAPTGETVPMDTIRFHIDHTPNLPDANPDLFSVTFEQPAPVNIAGTLVQFHVGVTPDFMIAENATVEKGDITVSFQPVTGGFTPVPEPATYAMWGAALLVGVVGYRRFRQRADLAAPAAG